ncbi:MAG: PD-(D/E)XK nuclease family protein [Elusimicrobia bacterium]|nr:PD-(D/E)XK nuclease family protein [Elusimicrobiota bacterium]
MDLVLPRPLSHSSISMYSECPQKYKFRYVDKIPEKPKHFFSFGQSVHSALEYFYGVKTLPPPSLKELLAHFKEHWVRGGYRDEAQEAEYFQDGKHILTKFYDKHIQDYAIPFFVEYEFKLKVEGVPVIGYVDRIDKLPDGRLAVLDYKTGKSLSSARVETDAQLTMYQMACEELLGAEVARLTFYHVPTLKEQVVERHPKKLVEGLRAKIVTTAESIVKGAFEPKPDEKVCRWCDYKPICPVYRDSYQTPETDPDELAGLIDRYGELQERLAEAAEEAGQLKADILASLVKKGFVRAFGKKFQVSRAAAEKWEFADKKKVLELIKKAGLYEKVLAPSAPKVEQLMSDPALPADLRARLGELGVRVETPDLKVKPL